MAGYVKGSAYRASAAREGLGFLYARAASSPDWQRVNALRTRKEACHISPTPGPKSSGLRLIAAHHASWLKLVDMLVEAG